MSITMKEFKIYCLKHPKTLEIRYVGVTSSTLKRRYYQHIHSALHRRGTRVSKWIYSLSKDKLNPLIELLEITTEELWEEREIYWISQYNNLTNTDPGGKGVVINRTYDSIQRSANAKKIPIVQLDESGNLIKEWASSVDATNALGLGSNSCITNVLKGNRGAVRAGGYKWAYKDEYYSGSYTVRYDASRVDYNKLKKVCLYDINNNFIKEYPCLNKLVVEMSPNAKNYTAARKAMLKGSTFKQHYIRYSESI